MFCPEGSGLPLAVQVGYYTVASSGDDTEGESDSTVGAVIVDTNITQNARTYSRQRRVAERLCESGHYCMGGLKYMCPPGTFGRSYGLSTSACSGLCDRGYLCPLGSVFSNQTHCGDPSFYCPDEGVIQFRSFFFSFITSFCISLETILVMLEVNGVTYNDVVL